MSSDHDSRRHTRKPLKVELQVGDTSLGGELHFDSLDFSEGGVFLASELLFEVGEVLWISFVLPEAAFAIRTRGRVVWTRKETDPEQPDELPGMGISFLDLSAAERAALGEYLAD